MALRKTVTTQSGYQADYHRIAGGKFELETYRSEEDRRNGATPIDKRTVRFSNTEFFAELIASLYGFVPTLTEELSEAMPVFEEGQIDSQDASASK